ncbi:MAG: metallothionein [Myxococcaceae bacterium]
MVRPLYQLVPFAAVGALLVCAPASAKSKPVRASSSKPASVKTTPEKQPGSVMDMLDDTLASKCSCTSQADCTCKRGQCECKKCGGLKKTPMIETLKGTSDSLKLPKNARNDASAGVFI